MLPWTNMNRRRALSCLDYAIAISEDDARKVVHKEFVRWIGQTLLAKKKAMAKFPQRFGNYGSHIANVLHESVPKSTCPVPSSATRTGPCSLGRRVVTINGSSGIGLKTARRAYPIRGGARPRDQSGSHAEPESSKRVSQRPRESQALR